MKRKKSPIATRSSGGKNKSNPIALAIAETGGDSKAHSEYESEVAGGEKALSGNEVDVVGTPPTEYHVDGSDVPAGAQCHYSEVNEILDVKGAGEDESDDSDGSRAGTTKLPRPKRPKNNKYNVILKILKRPGGASPVTALKADAQQDALQTRLDSNAPDEVGAKVDEQHMATEEDSPGSPTKPEPQTTMYMRRRRRRRVSRTRAQVRSKLTWLAAIALTIYTIFLIGSYILSDNERDYIHTGVSVPNMSFIREDFLWSNVLNAVEWEARRNAT